MLNDSSNQEEFDLREMIHTLWNGKWIIIFSTVIFSVASFTISKYFSPQIFHAKAYISIIERAFPITLHTPQSFVTDTIIINSRLPNIDSMSELALSFGILNEITNTSMMNDISELTEQTLVSMLNVKGIGTDQIQLVVKDTNPVRATEIANLWAEKVVNQIIFIYGISTNIEKINIYLDQSINEMVDAKNKMNGNELHGKINLLGIQLMVLENSYSCALRLINENKLLSNELGRLEKDIGNDPAILKLNFNQKLSLYLLQQRVHLNDYCLNQDKISFPNEHEISNLIIDPDIIISEIGYLIEAQRLTLFVNKEEFKDEIISITSIINNLENEVNQQQKLFNLAEEKYSEILILKTRFELINASGNGLAIISAKAITPTNPSSPNIKMNTLVAGIMGVIIGVSWVIFSSMGINLKR